jgi:hypothetical protein
MKIRHWIIPLSVVRPIFGLSSENLAGGFPNKTRLTFLAFPAKLNLADEQLITTGGQVFHVGLQLQNVVGILDELRFMRFENLALFVRVLPGHIETPPLGLRARGKSPYRIRTHRLHIS